VKSYYDLLGVEPSAPPDEIKRAFRHEIARYHPDKVQHLGPEFQQIAAVRAAELTEAYRVLMDPGERSKYDDSLREPPVAAPSAPAPAEPAPQPRPSPDPGGRATGPDGRVEGARATSHEFVRKAALSMLRQAIDAVVPGAEPTSARGFDAAFLLRPRRALFSRSEPAMQLLARFVPEVNAAAVEESWPLALGAASNGHPPCVLLLGGALAPARELAGAVSAQRRRTRLKSPVLVPVDVRDWEALFPADVPGPVRSIVERLRDGRK
jgi:curved DNA-binding protein CbpA